MIILDSNVISEIQKINCDPNVRRWSNEVSLLETRLCSIVYAELRAGAKLFHRRNNSEKYLKSLEAVIESFRPLEILPFDRLAADRYADLKANSELTGKTRPTMDLMIAAICLANGATLATRNIKDFRGLDVPLINPFEAGTRT